MTSLTSALQTIWSRRKDLFLLVVFFVKIWLACDFLKLNFPDPVFLNLFAAALFVLIFGILLSSNNVIAKKRILSTIPCFYNKYLKYIWREPYIHNNLTPI